MRPEYSGPGFKEFIILMALLTSLVAMSIDSMLPALSAIAGELNAKDNEQQFVISSFLLAFGVAQMGFGPLSDSIGRKPVILIGILVFILGSIICIYSTTFDGMLIGRAMQGIGVAGPRIATLALVRDRFEGDAMARVMSLVMMIFILVPVFAPAIGQGIMFFAEWRAIFTVLIAMAVVGSVWLILRQPETLARDKRRPFALGRIGSAVLEIFRTRASIGYIIMSGLIFSGFVGYLSSSQQIFQDVFGLGEMFPLYFGLLASALGVASYSNSKLVVRFGMRRLCRTALVFASGLSILFLCITYALNGLPSLPLFMAYMIPVFFCFGILFGNFVALAMEPLGHIAGIGASAVGSISSLISVPLGAVIGQHFDGTVFPLVAGFTFFSVSAFLLMQWVEAKKK